VIRACVVYEPSGAMGPTGKATTLHTNILDNIWEGNQPSGRKFGIL